MNKKFSNIIFIGALVILTLLVGVNVVNNIKNIEVKDLYGDRTELGNVDFNVNRNMGAFFDVYYNIEADSIKSKTMFTGDGENKSLYENRDVLRGVYVYNANSYDSKDYLAVVNSEYQKKTLDFLLKDKKSGDVKKASVKMNPTSQVLGVYAENNKIKFIIPENEEESSGKLLIKEYNFETNTMKTVANVGSYTEKMGLEYRDGDNYYISKIIRATDETKHFEEIKNLNIYKINLKDNSVKEYDVRKLLEENKIDLKGKIIDSFDVSDGVACINISDGIDWSKISDVEKISENYKSDFKNMPKVYSVATLNLNDGKVSFYKDCLDTKEVDKYIENLYQPRYLSVYDDKLYFSLGVYENDMVVFGVVNLKDNKLVYLGELNNIRMNGGFTNK